MAAAALDTDLSLWSEEPASRPDRARIRARIGGLHCSLCTGTIEKALGRLPGVEKVAVSLTHEQALIEYDPAVTRPDQLLAHVLQGVISRAGFDPAQVDDVIIGAVTQAGEQGANMVLGAPAHGRLELGGRRGHERSHGPERAADQSPGSPGREGDRPTRARDA